MVRRIIKICRSESSLGKHFTPQLRQQACGKHDKVDVKISAITCMAKINGRDSSERGEKSVEDQMFAPVMAASPHSPQAKNHHRPLREEINQIWPKIVS